MKKALDGLVPNRAKAATAGAVFVGAVALLLLFAAYWTYAMGEIGEQLGWVRSNPKGFIVMGLVGLSLGATANWLGRKEPKPRRGIRTYHR